MSSRSGSNSFKSLFISELWIASVQSMLVMQHSLFYETLYFGRISKLEKSYQNNTKSSFMCFAQILKCLHFIKFYVLVPTSVCMYMCVCMYVFLCTDGPQIMTVHLNDFSTLRWCMFSGDHTLNFWILIFCQAGDMWCSSLSWCWVRAASHSPLLQGLAITGAKTCSTDNRSTHITVLLFTFSSAFSPFHEIVNTSLQDRLCVRRFSPAAG